MLGLSRVALLAVLLAAVVLAAGCGGPSKGEQAKSTGVRFADGLRARRGAAVCSALTSSDQQAIAELAATQGLRGCPTAVLGLLSFAVDVIAEASPDELRDISVEDDTLDIGSAAGLRALPTVGGRIALLRAAGLRRTYQASIVCSRYARTLIAVPLPPPDSSQLTAYLRGILAAAQANQAALVRLLGPHAAPVAADLEAEHLPALTDGLAGSPGDSYFVSRALPAAARVLMQNDVTSDAADVPTASCGPDPLQAPTAVAFARHLQTACGSPVMQNAINGFDSPAGRTQMQTIKHVVTTVQMALGERTESRALEPLRVQTAAALDDLQGELARAPRASAGQAVPGIAALNAASRAEVGTVRLGVPGCLG